MKNYTEKIVSFLNPYFAKAPVLPQNWKQGIVSVIPWFALIFGILGIIGAVTALGLVSVFSPLLILGGTMQAPGQSIILVLFALASSALLLAAFPSVRARRIKGWDLLLWSEILSIVSSVVSLSLFGILFSVVGLYILFQVRSLYK